MIALPWPIMFFKEVGPLLEDSQRSWISYKFKEIFIKKYENSPKLSKKFKLLKILENLKIPQQISLLIRSQFMAPKTNTIQNEITN